MNSNKPLSNNIKAISLEDLVQASDELTAVIEKETDILKESNMDAFKAMQDEKRKLTDRYEAQIKYLVAHKEQVEASDSALKDKLNEAREKMHKASQDNLSALERTGKSINRLGERILHAARDAATKQTASYSAKGALYTNEKTPVSIGVGEVI